MLDEKEPNQDPAWMITFYDRIIDLRRTGNIISYNTYKCVFLICHCLEVENVPCPDVQIVSPKLVRLIWTKPGKTLAIDCRAGYFTVQATERKYSGAARTKRLEWVDHLRRSIAWVTA